jgi:hypothetical protein
MSSQAQVYQLVINRHVVLRLLIAALGVVVTFLPAAATAQDLAGTTPDVSHVATDVATTDAAAYDWPPAGPAPTPRD